MRFRLSHPFILLTAFILILLLSGSLQAKSNATNIERAIVSDTWTAAGNPYLLSGNIDLWGSLIIEPDVVIMMHPGSRLNVYGTLTINGTAEKPVYFTSIKDDDTPLYYLWHHNILAQHKKLF
jgi:hypothetical protein